jgi:uncharacterized protein YabN with tetrapyrrole methylase and pyrophosphatase domain
MKLWSGRTGNSSSASVSWNARARKDGKVLGEMSLDEMNAYWERAKAR